MFIFFVTTPHLDFFSTLLIKNQGVSEVKCTPQQAEGHPPKTDDETAA
jgi:hypothetical protein